MTTEPEISTITTTTTAISSQPKRSSRDNQEPQIHILRSCSTKSQTTEVGKPKKTKRKQEVEQSTSTTSRSSKRKLKQLPPPPPPPLQAASVPLPSLILNEEVQKQPQHKTRKSKSQATSPNITSTEDNIPIIELSTPTQQQQQQSLQQLQRLQNTRQKRITTAAEDQVAKRQSLLVERAPDDTHLEIIAPEGFMAITFATVNISKRPFEICCICGGFGGFSGAGNEIITCSNCCESYHTFCLDSESLMGFDKNNKNNNLFWRCKSCRICLICGIHCDHMKDSKYICCENCKYIFHVSCMPKMPNQQQSHQQQGMNNSNKTMMTTTTPSLCCFCQKLFLSQQLEQQIQQQQQTLQNQLQQIQQLEQQQQIQLQSPQALSTPRSSHSNTSPEIELAANALYLMVSPKLDRPPSPIPPCVESFENDPFDVPFAEDKDDPRVCSLCNLHGEIDPQLERLLPLEIDSWVHVNCALWSHETKISIENGSITNIKNVIENSRNVICTFCGKQGASVHCENTDCRCRYHLPCAMISSCSIQNKGGASFIVCPGHSKQDLRCGACIPGVVQRKIMLSDGFPGISTKRQRCTKLFPVRLGCLTVYSIGKPIQDNSIRHYSQRKSVNLQTIECQHVGWLSTRVFWDFRNPYEKCLYRCSIASPPLNNGGSNRPIVRVTLLENDGFEGPTFVGVSINDVWRKIVMLVFFSRPVWPLSGEQYFGLSHPWTLKIFETLTVAQHKLHPATIPIEFPQWKVNLPSPENLSGCSRTEGIDLWKRLKTKKIRDGNNLAASINLAIQANKTSSSTNLSINSLTSSSLFYRDANLPLAMRFRQLPQIQKDLLVWKSPIQGLGVFAKVFIPSGTMLIEYKGEIIRQSVGDIREENYRRQLISDYQFSLQDGGTSIDATMKGNAARFINHSCGPNCKSYILTIGGKKHIVISSIVDIYPGEELAYDYQFDYDETDKFPCHCGSPKCSGYMNWADKNKQKEKSI